MRKRRETKASTTALGKVSKGRVKKREASGTNRIETVGKTRILAAGEAKIGHCLGGRRREEDRQKKGERNFIITIWEPHVLKRRKMELARHRRESTTMRTTIQRNGDILNYAHGRQGSVGETRRGRAELPGQRKSTAKSSNKRAKEDGAWSPACKWALAGKRTDAEKSDRRTKILTQG